MRSSRSSLAVVLALALVAVLSFGAPSSVSAVSYTPDPWLFSTSDFTGSSQDACVGLAPLVSTNGDFSLSTGVVGGASNASADCPAASYPTPPIDGLALNLAAIDPAVNKLYLIEGQTDGTQVLATSALGQRSAVTRFPLGPSEQVIAMTLGMSRGAGLATPLTLLVSNPLELRSIDPATGTQTSLIDEFTLESTRNMTHAVAGVLVLNDVAGEVYWIGLSGATPPLPSGELNTTALKLYAMNLTAPSQTREFDLEGVDDVLSLHFSAKLNALIVVTSTEVRAAPLPTTRALVSSPVSLTSVKTYPVGASGFLYASQWPAPGPFEFDGLHTSSYWSPEANQLVLAVVLKNPAKQQLVTLTLARTGVTNTFTFATPLELPVAELPLFLQGGIAQLSLTSAPPSVGLGGASPNVVLDGFGLTQALVRPTLECVWTSPSVAGEYKSPAVHVPTFPVNSLMAQHVRCDIPAALRLPTTKTLSVSLSSVNGFIRSGSLTIDVDECDPTLTTPACPGQWDVCTNSNTGNGFTCVAGTAVCAVGQDIPPTCDPCAKGTYKNQINGEPCKVCAVGKTTASTGTISPSECIDEAPCDLALVSPEGEGMTLAAAANGGANVPVRLRIREMTDLELWQRDPAANELAFRENVAMQLNLFNDDGSLDLSRIGPVENVEEDQWLPLWAVVVTFSILPASPEDQAACIAGGGTVGQSPGSLGAQLVAIGGSNVTVVLDLTPPGPVLSRMGMGPCVADSIPSLAILASLLLGTCLVYLLANSKPRLPRSRAWEVFPTMLPLIALGYDAWFITKIGMLAPSADSSLLLPLVPAIVLGLFAVGFTLNLTTMLYYGHQQLRVQQASVVSTMVTATAEDDVVKKMSVIDVGAAGGGASPLKAWRKASPLGSHVAFWAGVLNINALGMCSSRLTSRHSVWHIKWDRQRSHNLGYHQLLRTAGFRSMLCRSLPMLLVQAAMMMQLDCPVWAAAPLIAGLLALVAVIVRMMYIQPVDEPTQHENPNGKYVVRGRRQLPNGNWVDGSDGNGEERYVETDSESSSRRSGTSSSRVSVSGRLAGGAKVNPLDEDSGHYRAGPHLLAGGSVLGLNATAGASDLPHQPMSMADDDGYVEVEMSAEEEAELAAAGLNSHAWQLVDNVDDQLAGGGPLARFRKRMTQMDADRVMARRARVNAAAAFSRKAAAIPADIVQRTMAAAQEAREVASSSHVWLLFDDPTSSSPLPPLSQPIGPDQVVRSVEQFDENGMPFNPAMFKRYVANKSDLAVVSEARKAVAEKPEVKARKEKAEQAAREVVAMEHAWILLDPSLTEDSAVDHSAIELKEVEIFTEEGAPYDPAFFKRFVRAAPPSPVAAAAAPPSTGAPLKPLDISSHSESKAPASPRSTNSRNASLRTNALSSVLRSPSHNAQISAGADAILARKASVSSSAVSAHGESTTSQSSSSSAASSGESQASDKDAVAVNVRERLASDAAAERAAVAVREVDGVREVVKHSPRSAGAKSESDEEAAVIGELNLGGRGSRSPTASALGTPPPQRQLSQNMSRQLSHARLQVRAPPATLLTGSPAFQARAALLRDGDVNAAARLVIDADDDIPAEMARAGSAWNASSPKFSGQGASNAAAALVGGSPPHSGSVSRSRSRSSHKSVGGGGMGMGGLSDGEHDLESAEVVVDTKASLALRRGARAALLSNIAKGAEARAANLGAAAGGPGSPTNAQLPSHLRSPSALRGAGASEAPMSPLAGGMPGPALARIVSLNKHAIAANTANAAAASSSGGERRSMIAGAGASIMNNKQ
jgi:hypothetical protein